MKDLWPLSCVLLPYQFRILVALPCFVQDKGHNEWLRSRGWQQITVATHVEKPLAILKPRLSESPHSIHLVISNRTRIHCLTSFLWISNHGLQEQILVIQIFSSQISYNAQWLLSNNILTFKQEANGPSSGSTQRHWGKHLIHSSVNSQESECCGLIHI